MAAVRPSIQGTSARYEPLFKLATGGMATVYVGRLVGALGFQRFVAIKRPHQHLLANERLVKTLLDEATVASRLHHPNVVSVQDVVRVNDDVYLVMDLVEGASLSDLGRVAAERSIPIPPAVILRWVLDTCAGLHAAHELTNDDGLPLGLVHRDVSPQNVLVGVDGVARVTDFGIANCANVEGPSTTTGTLKGKYAYMAPEYVQGRGVDRRSDIFSLGVMAWELLAERRLFLGDSPASTMMNVLHVQAPALSTVTDAFGTALDEVLARALAKQPSDRWETMEALAEALEAAARSSKGVAGAAEAGKLVRALVGEDLEKRKRYIKNLIEDRSEHGPRDESRATEPLPLHLEALDAEGSIADRDLSPKPPPLEPTDAKPSRPAVLPAIERTSGVHPPMQISQSVTGPVRAQRRYAGLLLLVVLAVAVGALTLGIRHMNSKPTEPSHPVLAASASPSSESSLSAPSLAALPASAPVSWSDGADTTDGGIGTGAPAAAASTRAGGQREKRRSEAERGAEGARGSRGSRADAGAVAQPVEETAGEPVTTHKVPPPNPYATAH